MAQFSGFLDRWSLRDAALELRLSSGAYHSDRTDPEIEYVTVEELADPDVVAARLTQLRPYQTELSLDDSASTGELTIQIEDADPLVLRGKRVGVRPCTYEPADYERFTRMYYDEVVSLHDSFRATMAQLADARHLLEEQAHRVAVKAEGHARGTTARKLYDQQLVFIARAVDVLNR